MTTEINRLRTEAERIAADFDRRKATLYRPDGAPVYGPEELAERLEKIQQERTQQLQPIEREARRIAETARQKAQAAGGADPANSLTADELSRANSLRGFTNDFCQSAGLGEVVDRLRAVTLEGDRASLYAHLAASEKRLRRERDREPGSPSPGPIAMRHVQVLESELLPEMRSSLGSSDEATKQKREAAEAEVKAAEGAEIFIGNLKVGARTLYQRLYEAG